MPAHVFLSPCENEVVSLQTDIQRLFVKDNGGIVSTNALNVEQSETPENSRPAAVYFEWDSTSDHFLLLATEPSMNDAVRIPVSGNSTKITNLLANQTYYWCSESETRPHCFRTADLAPRWIAVDGLSNVRDMGAWQTEDGHRIRQGFLFRGSEMNTHQTITAKGIQTLKDELKIRTDLDLRKEAVDRFHISPLGWETRYIQCPILAYEDFFHPEERAYCRRALEHLMDPDNYPIYFHCWGGADRTGTAALLLESILGMSPEDIFLDYELTSLSVWGKRSRYSMAFQSLLDSLSGFGKTVSFHEQVHAFLLECGISEDRIQSFREFMLEPASPADSSK